jgi:hypothetical protein
MASIRILLTPLTSICADVDNIVEAVNCCRVCLPSYAIIKCCVDIGLLESRIDEVQM